MRGRRARYEEFQALDDVSLEVPAGTTFGLIGENGSGKSTLLKCMAKILRPDAGSINVNGKISALLELGAGFHPELSGKENIYLNGAILGLGSKDIDRKYDEIVEFAGLERFIDTPVKNYSSGMYVRLGFSVAINVEPDVLLVDEVLAVGDEAVPAAVQREVRRAAGPEQDHRGGVARPRRSCARSATSWPGSSTASCAWSGPAGDVVDRYVAEVQTDRHDGEGDDSARWGSGEALIEHIEVLGPDGRATTRLHTGDAVTFRLHYRAPQRVERPVFGLAFYNLEGMLVSGPNTREADMVPDYIEGEGVVDLTVDDLMLLPGTYDITASLYDYAIVHPFDFRQRVVRFDVDPGTPHETFGGVMSLNGRWSTTAGSRLVSRARRPSVAVLVDATTPVGTELDPGELAATVRAVEAADRRR